MKVFVAGHGGMVGSAFCRVLSQSGVDVLIATRSDLDLKKYDQVKHYLQRERPDAVILAAAKVGGISANQRYPVEFLSENLRIQDSVLNACLSVGILKLLFLGSSCIYPKGLNREISEQDLMSGPLEPTNEAYAIAKITGVRQCFYFNKQYGADYRAVMPCNLFGLSDYYNPEKAHVIPSLIYRLHQAKFKAAKNVEIWGTGTPLREFMFVDDLARLAWDLMLIEKDKFSSASGDCAHINLGSGFELSISHLAKLIADEVGFKGKLNFNDSKPDGVSRKLMDSSKARSLLKFDLTDFKEALKATYKDFKYRLDTGVLRL